MKRFIKDEDILHAVLIFMAWMIYFYLNQISALVVMAIPAFLILVIRNINTLKKLKPFGGYANWTTLFRLIMLMVLGLLLPRLSNMEIIIIAGAALALDGVDGFLARKFNVGSEFGAKLDGETDAFFVLLLASINYHMDLLDSWVLWAGLIRYIFVMVCYAWWRKIVPEPPSMLRKTIAVIIMVALLTPFVLEEVYYLPIVIFATVAVTLSFIKSFIFQLRVA